MERDKKEKFYIHANWIGSQKTILNCAQNGVDLLYKLHEYDSVIFSKIEHSAKKLTLIDFSKNKEQTAFEVAEQFVDANMGDLKKWTHYDIKPDINTIKDPVGCWFRFWGNYGTNEQIHIKFQEGSYNNNSNLLMIEIPPKFINENYDWYLGLLKLVVSVISPQISIVKEFLFNREYCSNYIPNEIGTGWMVYIANDFVNVMNEKGEVTSHVFGKGKIFVSTEEEFSKNNPKHVEEALRLRDYFNKNGYYRAVRF